jgi:hypothetical protein
MARCPICRAALNGAETCRRCRAELQLVIRMECMGRRLVDAAIHSLSLDDPDIARRLLRRALTVHATPETQTLWQLATTLPRGSGINAYHTGAVDHPDPGNP